MTNGGTPGDEPVRPDYAGASVAGLVPALLGPERRPWLPACVAGARAVVLLVLDGFGWRAIEAARARLPVLGGLEGGPITTVVPSTTAAALTSIASGLTPARHGMVGYRMLVGGQVLDVLRWKVPEGRAPDPGSVTLVGPAFCGRNVPTVVRAEFKRSGFTESHMRGVRFVGWRTTATLVTHVARLVDAGEPFVYAYYDGVDKVAHEYGITDGFFPAETAAADRLVGDLLDALPGDAALVITADHGQVQFERWVTMEPVAAQVRAYAGDARLRYLYARPGRERRPPQGGDRRLRRRGLGLRPRPAGRRRVARARAAARRRPDPDRRRDPGRQGQRRLRRSHPPPRDPAPGRPRQPEPRRDARPPPGRPRPAIPEGVSMIGFVLGLVIQGALFGVALRAILPGEQRWTIAQTIGIGVVGWLVIGFVLRAIFGALFGLLLPLLILGGVYLFVAQRRGGARRGE